MPPGRMTATLSRTVRDSFPSYGSPNRLTRPPDKTPPSRLFPERAPHPPHILLLVVMGVERNEKLAGSPPPPPHRPLPCQGNGLWWGWLAREGSIGGPTGPMHPSPPSGGAEVISSGQKHPLCL
uniref:Uncharacterized protein n=1 Tax=Morchella brunnea TaxID=1174671 RepID=A0A8K1MGH8_9PEZI|nr:hypothetical protein LK370_mgp072 [Morchella brunnea]UBU98568.1 hypothetical protein [Morchella brunnea]